MLFLAQNWVPTSIITLSQSLLLRRQNNQVSWDRFANRKLNTSYDRLLFIVLNKTGSYRDFWILVIDPVPSPKKTHCSANRKVFIRSLDSHEVLVQNTKLSLETVPRSLLQKVPPLWVCGNKQNETQSVRTSSADKWRSTLCTAGIIHTKSRFLLHFLAQRTTRPNFQCHFQCGASATSDLQLRRLFTSLHCKTQYNTRPHFTLLFLYISFKLI